MRTSTTTDCGDVKHLAERMIADARHSGVLMSRADERVSRGMAIRHMGTRIECKSSKGFTVESTTGALIAKLHCGSAYALIFNLSRKRLFPRSHEMRPF